MNLTKRESNYKAWVAEWKQKEEDLKKTAKQKPHTLATAKNLADLARRGVYRKNGFFYIRLTSSKAARRTFYDLAPGAPVDKKASYGFDFSRRKSGSEYCNYLSGSQPYKNEAHHLLPVKAFGKKFFKPNQLTMLKKLPYCVNHGENIIFLPKQAKSCAVHNLPQHNGSHPPYNAAVATDAATLAAKMQEKAQDPCDPDDPIQLSVLKEMIKYQAEYWKLLVAAGAGVTVKQVGEQRVAAQSTPAVSKRSL